MLEQNGYTPEGILIASTVDELVISVACGLAVSHLFRHTEKLYNGMIKFIKTRDHHMDLEIDMVWNRNNKNKAKNLLLDYVKNENAKIGLTDL